MLTCCFHSRPPVSNFLSTVGSKSVACNRSIKPFNVCDTMPWQSWLQNTSSQPPASVQTPPTKLPCQPKPKPTCATSCPLHKFHECHHNESLLVSHLLAVFSVARAAHDAENVNMVGIFNDANAKFTFASRLWFSFVCFGWKRARKPSTPYIIIGWPSSRGWTGLRLTLLGEEFYSPAEDDRRLDGTGVGHALAFIKGLLCNIVNVWRVRDDRWLTSALRPFVPDAGDKFSKASRLGNVCSN